MPEAAKPKTEQERPNSIAPGPAPDPGPAAAAVAPCGCEDRVGYLEGRMEIQEKLARAMSWVLIVCAAAVLYLAWTGAPTAAAAKADGAK